MEQPTCSKRRWICEGTDRECSEAMPHRLLDCGWWMPVPADRDRGGSCPYIVSSDEGTSYCSLAERGGPDLDALRELSDAATPGEWRHSGIWPDVGRALNAADYALAVAAVNYVRARLSASPEPVRGDGPGIEELRAENERLRAALTSIANDEDNAPSWLQRTALAALAAAPPATSGETWPMEPCPAPGDEAEDHEGCEQCFGTRMVYVPPALPATSPEPDEWIAPTDDGRPNSETFGCYDDNVCPSGAPHTWACRNDPRRGPYRPAPEAPSTADQTDPAEVFAAQMAAVTENERAAARAVAAGHRIGSRWLMQTILHDPDQPDVMGNCWQTCIASIFGLPLDDVPHFVQLHDTYDEVEAATRAWARERGFDMLDVPAYVLNGSDVVAMLHGRSPRNVAHVIVRTGNGTTHDPHPSRAGLSSIAGAFVFVPIDPAPVVGEPPSEPRP